MEDTVLVLSISIQPGQRKSMTGKRQHDGDLEESCVQLPKGARRLPVLRMANCGRGRCKQHPCKSTSQYFCRNNARRRQKAIPSITNEKISQGGRKRSPCASASSGRAPS
jgi:hypothetical protein